MDVVCDSAGQPPLLSTYPGVSVPSAEDSPQGESPLEEEKRQRVLLEKRHLEEVLATFKEYPRYMSYEVERRWQHICKLTPEQVVRLPPFSLGHKLNALKQAIATNHLLLEAIVQFVDEVAQCKGVLESLSAEPGRTQLLTTPGNVSKIKSTLHCCVREWSDEGALERKQSFTPILQELEMRLPIDRTTRNKYRVLVPGAGLGRLPLEIAARGYSCQGNEFSYFMLLTSNFLLNHVDLARSISICPFVDQTCNIVKTADSLRPVLIPDVSPVDLLGLREESPEKEGGGGKAMASGKDGMEVGDDEQQPPDFSMAAGEFLEVYAGQSACWDCVVTCFFLDTAPVVVEYVDAIHRLLKPGGVWINFGPLLYHWAMQRTSPMKADANDGLDERYHRSVELTWEELRHVILSYGFRIDREELRESLYTCNTLSMMRTVYDCVFFTATKADAPQ